MAKPKIKIHLPELQDKPPLVLGGEEVILDVENLRPGDVLMSASTIEDVDSGYISWLVRVLDQSWYSHTAYYDGKNVIEAGLGKEGVRATDVREAIARNRYTDVFRFQSDECRTHGRHSKRCRSIGEDKEFPLEPLNAVARYYLGSEYALSDAVLAGILVMMRRTITAPQWMLFAIGQTLGKAMDALKKIVNKPEGKEAVTCSELVYRIFYEAKPRKNYRLIIGNRLDLDEMPQLASANWLVGHPRFEIPVQTILNSESKELLEGSQRHFRPSSGEAGIAKDIREFADLLAQVKSPRAFAAPDVASLNEQAKPIVVEHDANYVSPGDICKSGNLREIGRLGKAES